MKEESGKLQPIRFEPLAVKRHWGGSHFVRRFGKTFTETDEAGNESVLSGEVRVGECVEIADLGFQDSVASSGRLGGNTISEIMETYLEQVVGENVYYFYGRQFPLQVKYLDAVERMPLLVCPDDGIAGERYDALGKTKFWYVQEATPGSKLYLGFRREISAVEFYEKCKDGTIADMLNVVTPRKGDSFLIEPGTVHCAGGGLVIAEISEASDLDFTLCSWGQPCDDRGLTLEEAIDFVDMRAFKPADTGVRSDGDGHVHADIRPEDRLDDKLVRRKEFDVTRLRLDDAMHIYAEKAGAFFIYVCLEGAVSLQVPSSVKGEAGNMENYVLNPGETILVPADTEDFFLVPRERNTVLLEATVDCPEGEGQLAGGPGLFDDGHADYEEDESDYEEHGHDHCGHHHGEGCDGDCRCGHGGHHHDA